MSPNFPVWSDREARFYADALTAGTYLDAIGNVLIERLGSAESLLDIGAGSGAVGALLAGEATRWMALEPSRYMRARLGRLARSRFPGLTVHDQIWEDLIETPVMPHQVVLAANTSGPLGDPAGFHQALWPMVGEAMVWVVPAQCGPKRFCLGGLLDADLHGEDETPAVDTILARLPGSLQPAERIDRDWVFRGHFASAGEAEEHFRSKLGWPRDDTRLPALRAQLADRLTTQTGGVSAASPKKSAILIWRRR